MGFEWWKGTGFDAIERSLEAQTPQDRCFRTSPYQWTGTLELTDKEFVKLWQSCASTDELKKRYDALKQPLVHDALWRAGQRGGIPQSLQDVIDAAKASSYDYYRPATGSPQHTRAETYRRAQSFLKMYDCPEGPRRWEWCLSSRPFQSIKNMQARARRMRAKGVNLRKHARAAVHGYDYIDYAGLNEYANSFAA